METLQHQNNVFQVTTLLLIDDDFISLPIQGLAKDLRYNDGKVVLHGKDLMLEQCMSTY
jgi:hypothetical protein